MPRPDDTAAASPKVVDWELADIGDPAWDVGSVLQEFLLFRSTAQETAQRPLPEALAELRPATSRLRQAYAEGLSGEIKTHIKAVLEKSVLYAAARLIQSTIEYASASPVPYGMEPLLLMSRALFAEPRQATDALLGD